MAGGDGWATVAEIRARAAEVREHIRAAGDREDRVVLVAVTKGFPPEVAARALAAGLVDLGENYAQELVAKAAHLPGRNGGTGSGALRRPEPRWHFIGGLQSNKVKALAAVVDLWHTVDRASLAEVIARRVPGARILVQVNTTGEAQKSGCEPGQAPSLVERSRALGLDVRGLMTVGPTSAAANPRPGFELLRRLAARCEVVELSMGMSGDYEAAVEEGSTMVRIGSALFGARPPGRGTTA